jgi:hypothetical protein
MQTLVPEGYSICTFEADCGPTSTRVIIDALSELSAGCLFDINPVLSVVQLCTGNDALVPELYHSSVLSRPNAASHGLV